MEEKEEQNSNSGNESAQEPSQELSHGQKKDSEIKPLSTNKYIVAGVICIVAYVVIFFLSVARPAITNILNDFVKMELPWFLIVPISFVLNFFTLLGFESPMFIVMPFFAFFALFFLIDWIRKGFESKLSFGLLCLVIFILFVVMSLAAYYVALYWYVSNFASLQGIEMAPDMVDFWGKLTNSAFIHFIWGGMFGILARYVVEKIDL